MAGDKLSKLNRIQKRNMVTSYAALTMYQGQNQTKSTRGVQLQENKQTKIS